VLHSPPGRELQALVDLAALITGVPSAAINIITTSHQHQIATTGVEPSICLRADSMCAAVLEEKGPVVVPDASRDERFQDNPFVTGEIGGVRFYASAPLVTGSGVPLGRLCVFDDLPRELDEEQQQALDVLAERVVDVLELRLQSQELERSLEELTQTQDELHRSNERLTKFAAQVSHDLRTPLTAMMLNTELVAQEPAVADDEQLSTLLRTALEAGSRMARLIDAVLDFALVGAELGAERIDLDLLLAAVLDDLGPTIAECGAVVDVRGRLGSVIGNRPQLYSVFLNLLANAVKFSRPDRAPQVHVSAARTDDEVRVQVSDEGVGIPPDEVEGVFDLFTRGDGNHPGSGIGLATVRAAVEAHGGHVGVSSVPGCGTTFWFSLPA
jgi:signal transduction histidine kinase